MRNTKLKFLTAFALSFLASEAWAQVYAPLRPNPAILVSSRPVASQGGGEGGSGLSFSYALLDATQNSGTTLVMTPLVKPSTNSLIAVAGFVGRSTFTSCIDNRGNAFVQRAFEDRVTGQSVAVWNFVATATYNGAYTITLTWGGVSNSVATVVIASNTQTTASVDVSTVSRKASWNPVNMGTTTTTDQTTGLLVCGMTWAAPADDNPVTVFPANRWTLAGDEANGNSFATGVVAYSTTSVAGVTAFNGSFGLPTARDAGTACVAFKSP